LWIVLDYAAFNLIDQSRKAMRIIHLREELFDPEKNTTIVLIVWAIVVKLARRKPTTSAKEILHLSTHFETKTCREQNDMVETLNTH
jgi:hypothetical protein